MFAVIGIFVVWLAGLIACFYMPFIGGLMISDMTHNLGTAVLGWWVALAAVALYLAATVAYIALN